MGKSMIIVGAGIAGLSAGCYARMNGYETAIFEMHTIPGGLCTAWSRKGYTFDISMHFLTGSKRGPLKKMWRELGVMEDQEFYYHDEALYIDGGEKNLSVCTDPRRLEEQMRALSPEDAGLIKEFLGLYCGRGMMGGMTLKPEELTGPLDKLKMLASVLPLMKSFRRWGNQTIQEFAEGFRDPFLRHAVRFFIDTPGWPMPQFPLVLMAGAMKMSVKEGGVPLGGPRRWSLAWRRPSRISAGRFTIKAGWPIY